MKLMKDLLIVLLLIIILYLPFMLNYPINLLEQIKNLINNKELLYCLKNTIILSIIVAMISSIVGMLISLFLYKRKSIKKMLIIPSFIYGIAVLTLIKILHINSNIYSVIYTLILFTIPINVYIYSISLRSILHKDTLEDEKITTFINIINPSLFKISLKSGIVTFVICMNDTIINNLLLRESSTLSTYVYYNSDNIELYVIYFIMNIITISAILILFFAKRRKAFR